jgi:hypothetical protein
MTGVSSAASEGDTTGSLQVFYPVVSTQTLTDTLSISTSNMNSAYHIFHSLHRNLVVFSMAYPAVFLGEIIEFPLATFWLSSGGRVDLHSAGLHIRSSEYGYEGIT